MDRKLTPEIAARLNAGIQDEFVTPEMLAEWERDYPEDVARLRAQRIAEKYALAGVKPPDEPDER